LGQKLLSGYFLGHLENAPEYPEDSPKIARRCPPGDGQESPLSCL